MKRIIGLLLCAICVLSSDLRATDGATDVKMTLLTSGAVMKVGSYRPQRLNLSSDKPQGVKKAPAMVKPLYGSLEFGGKLFLIAIDEPEGKDASFFVDANGNGDLSDDAPVAWEKRSYPGPNGTQLTQYMGSFKLPLNEGGQGAMVSLTAYRFDKNDAQRAALKNVLLYYGDYAYEGEITLGGEAYKAMLVDDNATGDFRGKEAVAPAVGSGVRILIDVNKSGRFDARGEMFDVKHPFNIKGTTYELADLTATGAFKVKRSEQTVAEILPPPDHSVGKKITPFKAKKMDGTEVSFPSDYKGKIVMLDFWATWCGPCMVEVPGLVNAYNEFHPKGLEILGISLDQPNSAEKVKSVTGEKGMTWNQVYDGKYWQAEIADRYGINSIPAAFLVDGDTGEVLAAGNSLRGTSLEKTLADALAKKFPGAK